MLVKGGPGLTVPYHPWTWLARQMANRQPSTCFTNDLLIHKQNLMKKLFYSIFVSNNSIRSSQLRMCHKNVAVMICAKLWPDWIILVLRRVMHKFTKSELWGHRECVEWILGSIRLSWLSSSHSIKSWSNPPISLQTDWYIRREGLLKKTSISLYRFIWSISLINLVILYTFMPLCILVNTWQISGLLCNWYIFQMYWQRGHS